MMSEIGLTTFASVLGGIGLFILGMRMMTEGLKIAAGNALRSILHTWTNSAFRGLLAGAMITAVVQSSSAVTVATVGFVNAGLLTLTQAVWVVYGTNVGTTMTGWLVALVGVKVEVGALALPLIGIGMLLRLVAGSNVQRAGFGEALAGFGAFFLGVGTLQGGFADLAPGLEDLNLERSDWTTTLLFVAVGLTLTVLTQSSSAAIAIALTATVGGALPLELAASAVIGTNIGTTSTAFFASIGATPPAKRVATAHITFNLLTALVALAMLPLLLIASRAVIDVLSLGDDTPATLAVFHTLFNCLGVALIWPATPRLVGFLSTRFTSPEEESGQPLHIDATLTAVPALALRGLVLEVTRMMDLVFDIARQYLSVPATHREPSGLRQSGLSNLGQAIRGFIGELSAGALPSEVVEALPDLMRASQHLEDLAAAASEPVHVSEIALEELTEHHWDTLHAATLASLDCGDDGTTAGTLEALEELRLQVEETYQACKAQLLQAAARGKLRVAAMENALFRARQLRRCADTALKARRRLLPWRERIDPHVDDGASTSASVSNSTKRRASALNQ
jgi:phosphate:Na+ symporter